MMVPAKDPERWILLTAAEIGNRAVAALHFENSGTAQSRKDVVLYRGMQALCLSTS